MATVILSLPLMGVTISLALLLNVVALSWAHLGRESNAGGAGGEHIDLNSKDWAPIVESVDDKLSSEVLKRSNSHPWYTLTILNDLKKTSEASEQRTLTEAEMTLVKYLINLSRLDTELCTADYMNHFPSHDLDTAGPTLSNYIKHFRDEFFSMCRNHIMDETDKNVRGISELHQHAINKLELGLENKSYKVYPIIECVRKVDSEFLEPLSKVLKRFLEEGRSSNKDGLSKSPEPEVEGLPYELYQKRVLEPCEDWLSATEKVRGLIHHIDYDKRVCQQSRTIRIYQAVNKADVCKYIKDNNDKLVKSLGLNLGESSPASMQN